MYWRPMVGEKRRRGISALFAPLRSTTKPPPKYLTAPASTAQTVSAGLVDARCLPIALPSSILRAPAPNRTLTRTSTLAANTTRIAHELARRFPGGGGRTSQRSTGMTR
jgi:hypothetical protein